MARISARTTVGRKTPADGKLEITADFAERLLRGGAGLEVIVADERFRGQVEAMPCGCGKGGPGHVHHFLQSEALRQLPAGAPVTLEAELEPNVVRVRTEN